MERIRMRFSKEHFLKNAPIGVKRQAREHVDAIDGLDVVFDGRFEEYGEIPQYFFCGQEYYLYPVYRSWCIE